LKAGVFEQMGLAYRTRTRTRNKQDLENEADSDAKVQKGEILGCKKGRNFGGIFKTGDGH